jgi:hypothetical protein
MFGLRRQAPTPPRRYTDTLLPTPTRFSPRRYALTPTRRHVSASADPFPCQLAKGLDR